MGETLAEGRTGRGQSNKPLTALECYEIIVGEGGCNPEYFMNHMSWWEVQRYINGVQRKARTSWEVTRVHAFWILSALGAKLNASTDICSFPWDENYTPPTSEDDVEAALKLIHEANNR